MPSLVSETALLWMTTRNLNPLPSRETLIYAMGRVGREELPEGILEFLSSFPLGWRRAQALPEVEYVN